MREVGTVASDSELKNSHLFKHNRLKLVQHNLKLRTEIYKLEQIIDGLITNSTQQEYTQLEQSKQLEEKFQSQKQEQLAAIARLKKMVKKKKIEQAEHHN